MDFLKTYQSEFKSAVETWEESTREALSHRLTPEREAQLNVLIERCKRLIAETDELYQRYQDEDKEELWEEYEQKERYELFPLQDKIRKFWQQYGYSDLTVVRDGCVGLKSWTSGIVVPPIYEDICLTYDSLEILIQHRYVVKKDGKWGVINEKQEVLIPFEYDRLFMIPQHHGRYTLVKDGKQGVAELRNTDDLLDIGVPVEMDVVYAVPNWDLYLFTKNGKWGWWFPCVEEDKSFYHYYNAPAFDKIYIPPEEEIDDDEVTFIVKDGREYLDILYFTAK